MNEQTGCNARPTFKPALLPLLLGLTANPAFAANEDPALLAEVKRLAQRVAQLEAAIAEREANEREKAVIDRIEDMELEVLSLRKQARAIDAVEGVSVGAALTMVAQRINHPEAGKPSSQINYRADVSVTVPGGEIGEARGSLFAHFRLGQGEGVSTRNPPFTTTPNSTAFQLTNKDDSAALLAQAWYQLDVPLHKGAHELELNFGKMDPFIFFDQNAIADDETERFLDNAFVHNPLLDSGGDVGVDSYGFTPGVRVAYRSSEQSPDWWRVSLGAFGSGRGASFAHSLSRPFLIGQVEAGRQWIEGLDGTYRLYAWTTGRATPYANSADTRRERRAGWGFSVDQHVAKDATAFARYGHSTKGRTKFDHALTAGMEFGGSIWGCKNDRLGIAAGWLRAGKDFVADAPTLDADSDGNADFGYVPSGAERLAEAYYTWQLNDRFALSPDVQWISRPGADRSAKRLTVVGMRAKFGF